MIFPSACRSAEHDTAIATGHDAPCRGSRTTRTSWQKYLPPNCAPMPMFRVMPSTCSSSSRSRNPCPAAEPCGGSVSRYFADAYLAVFSANSAAGPADHDGQVVRRARGGAQRATWRALETGPLVAVALYLRDGDAAGALAALDRMQARDILASERRELAAALEAQAATPTSAHCVDLLNQLKPLTGREPARDDEDFSEDRDLFGAAAFGVAADCYRLDPSVPLVALTLAVALGELGMAEAAPAAEVAPMASVSPRCGPAAGPAAGCSRRSSSHYP